MFLQWQIQMLMQKVHERMNKRELFLWPHSSSRLWSVAVHPYGVV